MGMGFWSFIARLFGKGGGTYDRSESAELRAAREQIKALKEQMRDQQKTEKSAHKEHKLAHRAVKRIGKLAKKAGPHMQEALKKIWTYQERLEHDQEDMAKGGEGPQHEQKTTQQDFTAEQESERLLQRLLQTAQEVGTKEEIEYVEELIKLVREEEELSKKELKLEEEEAHDQDKKEKAVHEENEDERREDRT